MRFGIASSLLVAALAGCAAPPTDCAGGSTDQAQFSGRVPRAEVAGAAPPATGEDFDLEIIGMVNGTDLEASAAWVLSSPDPLNLADIATFGWLSLARAAP